MNKRIILALILILSQPGCGKDNSNDNTDPTPVANSQFFIVKQVVNRDYLPTLLDMIDNANKEILISHFEWHYDPVIAKIQGRLARAIKRGVKVRVLIEDSLDFNRDSIRYLENLNINVKLDSERTTLHSKLIIVDGNKVLIGSTNLSYMSIENNNETNMFIEGEIPAEYFVGFFQSLWDAPDVSLRLKPFISGNVSAFTNRQYVKMVKPLQDSAKKRIYVLMYVMKYYPDNPNSETNLMIKSLISASKRGVDVRVVLDNSDYNKALNKINKTTAEYLKKSGVKVSFESPSVITHAKLVIIDDCVVVGSTNWGHSGFRLYNGLNVIVNDKNVLDKFLEYYNKFI